MDGVQIKQAKEVRVFAHDALNINTPSNTRLANTENRGVCIYVGGNGNLVVKMESGPTVTDVVAMETSLNDKIKLEQCQN